MPTAANPFEGTPPLDLTSLKNAHNVSRWMWIDAPRREAEPGPPEDERRRRAGFGALAGRNRWIALRYMVGAIRRSRAATFAALARRYGRSAHRMRQVVDRVTDPFITGHHGFNAFWRTVERRPAEARRMVRVLLAGGLL